MKMNLKELSELLAEFLNNGNNLDEIDGMSESIKLSDYQLLEIIESTQSCAYEIATEQELSQSFDCFIEDLENFDFDDKVLIREEFANYADSLTHIGLLHLIQYENYEYVGRYS